MRTGVVLIGLAVIFAIGVAGLGASYVGSAQVTKPLHYSRDEVREFTGFLERSLIERDIEVAILFRTGRVRTDMPEGVLYTHGAFFVRTTVPDEQGRPRDGFRVHNLYQGDGNLSNTSSLVEDTPLHFVAGSVVPDIGVIIPSKELQAELKDFVGSEGYHKLHNPSYSIISNPFNDLYQNCNEFMLDVILSQARDTMDYDEIKQITREEFTPQRVSKGFFIDWIAPILVQDIAADDHEGRKFHTATFGTMGDYMKSKGYAGDFLQLVWEDAPVR